MAQHQEAIILAVRNQIIPSPSTTQNKSKINERVEINNNNDIPQTEAPGRISNNSNIGE